eukprot:1159667-Pelagomonas_calceolata.AAC.4
MHTDAHRRTQTHTDAHRRTQMHTDAHRCTQMHTDAHRRTQMHTSKEKVVAVMKGHRYVQSPEFVQISRQARCDTDLKESDKEHELYANPVQGCLCKISRCQTPCNTPMCKFRHSISLSCWLACMCTRNTAYCSESSSTISLMHIFKCWCTTCQHFNGLTCMLVYKGVLL